jgi:hypothetical protein
MRGSQRGRAPVPGPGRPAIRLTKKHDRNAEGKADCLRDRPDEQSQSAGATPRPPCLR